MSYSQADSRWFFRFRPCNQVQDADVVNLCDPEPVMALANCILASPGDAGNLHAALATLLADAALRQAYGRAGRETLLNHFTREKFVERTLTLYRQLLSRSQQQAAQPLLSQPA